MAGRAAGSARTALARALLLATVGAATFPGRATAQIRPLDPIDWSLLDDGWTLTAEAGAAVYEDQRSSVAGVEGRVYDLGVGGASVRLGGVVVGAAGAAQRWMRVDRRLRPPLEGIEDTDGRLQDVGEVRIWTLVPLSRGRIRAALEFGTRLPVTDAGSGLGRDRTDFFAVLGAQGRWAGTSVGAEAGLGIHGTYESSYFRQVDVLIYAVQVGRQIGWLRAGASLVGQLEGIPDQNIRGNEDLQEARLELRAGRSPWVRLELVRGLRDFSPRIGARLLVGGRW